jgi:hypothetical protein
VFVAFARPHGLGSTIIASMRGHDLPFARASVDRDGVGVAILFSG